MNLQLPLEEKHYIIKDNAEYAKILYYLNHENNLSDSKKHKSFTMEHISKNINSSIYNPNPINHTIKYLSDELASYQDKIYIQTIKYKLSKEYFYYYDINKHNEENMLYSDELKKTHIICYDINSQEFELLLTTEDEIANGIQQSTGNIIIKDKDKITIYNEDFEQLYQIKDLVDGVGYCRKICSARTGNMYFSGVLRIYKYNEKGIFCNRIGNLEINNYYGYDLMTTYEKKLILGQCNNASYNSMYIYDHSSGEYDFSLNEVNELHIRAITTMHYNNGFLYIFSPNLGKNSSLIQILDMRKNNSVFKTINIEQTKPTYIHSIHNIDNKIYIADTANNELYYVEI